jgi:hypothetical protein
MPHNRQHFYIYILFDASPTVPRGFFLEILMAVILSFDLADTHTDDYARIRSALSRFGWTSMGGSTWRYPAPGHSSETIDWFNNIVPALNYFRSMAATGNISVKSYTLDITSSASCGGDSEGHSIKNATQIPLLASAKFSEKMSEARLRSFIACSENNLK